MLKILKIIPAILMAAVAGSCDDLRDSYEDCGVWLEFVFDHNMEFTDSFSQQVGSVDVLLFDADDKLVLARAATTDRLAGRKRMFLSDDDLPKGDYTVVTVGGLCDHFRFSHRNNSAFIHKETALQDIKLAVLREENAMSRNIPHVWYGNPVKLSHRSDLSVCRVPLVRQTNNFYITLQNTVTGTRGPDVTRAGDPLYSAEIVAPEAGEYDYRNEPLVREKLTYRPHTQEASIIPSPTGATYRTVGRINTMRLLSGEQAGYRLVIRKTDTGAEVWGHDLLDLLPFDQNSLRADGTRMTMQEYLDREVNWNIIIDHRAPATEGFVAISITVNGWIVWQNPIGI